MKKKRAEKKGKSKSIVTAPEMKEENLNPRNLPVPVNVNPQALMSQAISSNLPVEQLERLMAMRRELKAEWSREQYFDALTKFQSICPQIEKTIPVKNKDGTTRYKFPPIEYVHQKVQPFLEKHGFSYTFVTEQDATSITSICIGHHRDGHEERSSFTVPISKNDFMTAQQHVASALSFADRYSFKRLFGIVFCGEDDDTNGFKDDTQKTKPPTLPKSAGKVPWPVGTQKPETKKPVDSNEISENEKCVAFAGRIGSFAIAQLEGDESKTKEWMLKTTSKLKSQGIQIREHATFRSMNNVEIVNMFEAMRKEIEEFESATTGKEKPDGK